MSGETVSEASDSDELTLYSEQGPLVQTLLAIRRSFLVFTVFLGFVMILGGVVTELVFTNQGVVAAMLVVWGISAVICGTIGYGLAIVLGLR
jgi:uncharacterized membrane protein YdbT with pleckstrin-like domain